MTHKIPFIYLLIILMGLNQAAMAQSRMLPRNGRIAFNANHINNVDDGSDIYTVQPDGSNIVNLTKVWRNDVFRNGGPQWSPNGNNISYFKGKIIGAGIVGDVMIMNQDGAGQYNITDSPASLDYGQRWSPDGKEILFISAGAFGGFGAGSPSEIYVSKLDGSEAINLTKDYKHEDSIAYNKSCPWSYDGKKIVFVKEASSDDIYKMNSDGSMKSNLTSDLKKWAEKPCWSPDGRRVVFDAGWDIYIMNDDGSEKIRLTKDGNSKAPSFSLDGKRIAFISNGDIYMMDTDGYNKRNMTNTYNLEEDDGYGWSPDGKELVYSAGEKSFGAQRDIYTLDIKTSKMINITGTKNMSEYLPDWQPIP